MSPTRMAVPAARALNRVGSPPEMVPSVEPINSEMAEVTVMVVCRELQNSQNQPAKHARVQARFGRQVGQRGVAQPGRH
jgi:hypothetical protein